MDGNDGIDTESGLALTPEEAKMYTLVLHAASQLPKTDPRYGFVIGMTWWLLHRRRRLEQARNRRRHFYRRWRRMLALRWQLQRNAFASASVATKLAETTIAEEIDTAPKKRNVVKKDLVDDFWSQVERDEVPADTFRRAFHMSQSTFNSLYSELEDYLVKSNTSMREALHGKKRLAATLYRLATNAEYMKVANLFSIGKSTITSLVRDVCEIIVNYMKDKYLTFTPGSGPTDTNLRNRIQESTDAFQIPQCIGILGCTDVYIAGGSWDWNDTSPYTSIYSKNFALVFQAVVSDQGLFNHVYAGCPSSLPNSAVLKRSDLKTVMAETFGPYQLRVEGVTVPVLVAAYDTSFGYPRQNWVLTPYRDDDIPKDPEVREKFNEQLSHAKTVFSKTVHQLRSRFKIFHGRNGKINFNPDSFEMITLACCILHNFCVLNEDPLDPEWSSTIGDTLLIRSSGVDISTEPASMEMDRSEPDGENRVSSADEVQALLAEVVASAS